MCVHELEKISGIPAATNILLGTTLVKNISTFLLRETNF